MTRPHSINWERLKKKAKSAAKKLKSDGKAKPSDTAPKDSDELVADQRKMTAFQLINERTGVVSLGVHYYNRKQGNSLAILDIDLLENPTKLRLRLKGQGALFQETTKAKQIREVTEMVKGMAAEKELTTKPGFRNNGFIMGKTMIGDAADHYVWPRPPGNKNETGDQLGAQRGTLKGWQDNVGKLLQYSSYATFGVGLGLGACLSSYVRMKTRNNGTVTVLISESAVLNLSGPSGSGKTSVGQLVAGLSGYPDDLHSWNTSRRGLAEDAESRNDHVLIVDDTEKCQPDKLEDALHMVNEDLPAGASRRIANIAQASLPMMSWHTWGLSSSPVPIDELTAHFEWHRTEGQRVRLIDIAVPDSREGGIFDQLPGTPAERGQASKSLIAQLAAGVASDYGVVLPAFVKYLLAEDRTETIMALFNEFIGLAAPGGRGLDERYAKKFAVPYAAGMLAVEAGILPLPKEWILKAVMLSYRKAQAGLAHDQNVLIRKLHDLHAATGDASRFPKAGSDIKTPVCFSDTTLGIQTEYKRRAVYGLVRERLKMIAGSNAGAKGLINLMDAKGIRVGGDKNVDTTQLPVPVQIDGRLVKKPRLYLLDAAKLELYLGKAKAA